MTSDLTNVLGFEIKSLNITIAEQAELNKKLQNMLKESSTELQRVEAINKAAREKFEEVLVKKDESVCEIYIYFHQIKSMTFCHEKEQRESARRIELEREEAKKRVDEKLCEFR